MAFPLTGAKLERVARNGSGLRATARARERSETAGFMKILVDPHTGRFLGASMIGIRCDEVPHAIIYLMHAGAT